MIPQVYWLCFTLLLVSMYKADEMNDMSVFGKYTREQECTSDTPLDELKPYGILMCLTKCLKLASCSHVRFHSKELICRLSRTLKKQPPGKPKNDEDWICWRKTSLVPYSDCQQGSTCIKSRSGETKCVHNDLQENLQRKGKMFTQPGRNPRLPKMTQKDLQENLQRKGKMFTQPGRNPRLPKMTQKALKGGWKTTVIRRTYKILSLTWSPSSVNDFYALTTTWSKYMVEMLMIKGSKLKNANPRHIIALHSLKIEWSTIDTGMCMTNVDLPCIYTFGKVKLGSTYTIYLRSYREVKNPRHLVLEREKEITKNIPATLLSCVFACNGKFGMGVYLRPGDSTAVQKYRIDVGEGALVQDGRMDVKGLVQMPQNIKWNIDGTVAIALCEKTFYIIIRCCNDKEQVDIEVKNKWMGWFAVYWTNTSIVVFDAQHEGRLAVFRSFKFT